jgi:hypothetical protein
MRIAQQAALKYTSPNGASSEKTPGLLPAYVDLIPVRAS